MSDCTIQSLYGLHVGRYHRRGAVITVTAYDLLQLHYFGIAEKKTNRACALCVSTATCRVFPPINNYIIRVHWLHCCLLRLSLLVIALYCHYQSIQIQVPTPIKCNCRVSIRFFEVFKKHDCCRRKALFALNRIKTT